MSEVDERSAVVKALVGGAALPALAVALAASAPLVNDPFITPVDGRALTLAWWFLVPLGVAIAIIRSRRLWTGAAIGVWSVAGFRISMGLLASAGERVGANWSPTDWAGAVFAIAMPWAIGMAFGWSSIQGRPRKLDGAPGAGGGTDSA